MIDPTTRRRVAPLVLAGILVVYLPVFFSARPERLERFWLLLLPDDLLMSWLGNDPRNFALADRLPLLAIVLVILLAAYALGRLAMHAVFRVSGTTSLETHLYCLAVGLNGWSLITLMWGLAGGLQRKWPMWALVAITVGWLVYHRWYYRQGGGTSPTPPATAGANSDAAEDGGIPSGRMTRVLGSLVVPFVLLILLGGMLPPWEFDVREYHLQVPKEWYQAGRIVFLPHNVYGNMPLGAELHALLAMVLMPGEDAWWWGALGGKTLIAVFAPLTGLAAYASGRRLAGPLAGVVAALVYLSIPWVTHVSVTGLVEGVSGFYTFLALNAALDWQQRSCGTDRAEEARSERGKLLLAGFLAGSAAACKYTGLVFVVAPALLLVVSRHLPWARWTRLRGKAESGRNRGDAPSDAVRPRFRDVFRATLGTATLFLVAAACACGPWYAKNAWQTGNPIYPLVFGGPGWTADRQTQWNRAHQVPRDEAGRRYSLRQAAASLAEFGWRDRGQSMLVVPLVLLALWCGRNRRWVALLAAYAVFFLVAWWMVTHRIDRFYVPLLPVLSLLAGLGAAGISSAGGRRLVSGLLVGGGCLNLLLILTADQQDHRYLVALRVLREDPPVEGRVSRVHPAHQYLNRRAEAVESVLLVGDAQPFDLEVPVVYNTCFDPNVLQRLIQDRTVDQRRTALHEAGISHVYVDWSEIARYRQPGNYGFTDFITRRLIWDELVHEQQLLRPVPLPLDPQSGELFEVALQRE